MAGGRTEAMARRARMEKRALVVARGDHDKGEKRRKVESEEKPLPEVFRLESPYPYAKLKHEITVRARRLRQLESKERKAKEVQNEKKKEGVREEKEETRKNNLQEKRVASEKNNKEETLQKSGGEKQLSELSDMAKYIDSKTDLRNVSFDRMVGPFNLQIYDKVEKIAFLLPIDDVVNGHKAWD